MMNKSKNECFPKYNYVMNRWWRFVYSVEKPAWVWLRDSEWSTNIGWLTKARLVDVTNRPCLYFNSIKNNLKKVTDTQSSHSFNLFAKDFLWKSLLFLNDLNFYVIWIDYFLITFEIFNLVLSPSGGCFCLLRVLTESFRFFESP